MTYREYLLGDISTFKYGSMPKKDLISESGYPIFTGYKYVGFYPSYNIDKESIIVVARGVGGTGDVKICPAKTHLTNLSIAFEINENILNKKYFYYKYSLSNLRYLDSGSAQSQITINDLKRIKLELPHIKEQKAIANILSSLDDKIELNNKINKNLEEIAQTLYKQWFVDFEFPNGDGEPYKSSGGEMVESELGLIPKGWNISDFDKILTLIKEPTKPGEHLHKRVYVPIDKLQSKHLVLSEYKPYTDANSSLILFDKFDILIGAMRVYFHKVNLSFNQGVTRTTTFVLRSKSIYEVPFNLLTLNQDAAIDYANGTSKGSTMPYAVWENAFSRYAIVDPNIKIKKKFFDIVMPKLQLLNNNNIQNIKLQKIRDELLPKLMNGEIEVPIEE